MLDELIVRYIHFTGVILLSSMLVAENVLMGRELDQKTRKSLVSIDRLYGLGAIITLAAGLSLWLWVGKPKAFYSANPLFHAKLGLFVLIGVLSIIPTVFIARSRNANQHIITVPGGILLIKRLELLGLLVLPLLAVLMARGVGLA